MNTDTFTTGQVARICRVNDRTIGKWIDQGRIPGSFRLPGNNGQNHRRVPKESLVKFMEQHGFYIPPELAAGIRVVLVGMNAADTKNLTADLPCFVRTVSAETFFQAGEITAREAATVLVCDLGGLDVVGHQAASFALRSSAYGMELVAVILAEGDSVDIPEMEKLVVYRPPFSCTDLARRLIDLAEGESL